MQKGYTIEEIQEWFLHGKHNKKMIQPFDASYAKMAEKYHSSVELDKTSGLFLEHHNTVIVLHRGILHNTLGPAKVMLTKEGKPYYSIFARDGEIIQWDGFEVKVRQTQVKKIENQMNKEKTATTKQL